MPVQSVPLGSVTVGPQSWRDDTARCIRRAEHLVREAHPGRSGPGRPRSCSAVAFLPKRTGHGGGTGLYLHGTGHGGGTGLYLHGTGHGGGTGPYLHGTGTGTDNQEGAALCTTRPQTTGTMFPHGANTSFAAPFPPPCLRERCAEASVGQAGEYTRGVREVEGQLRRQAGRVTQEGVKLERERGHLESMLRSLRGDMQVNRQSVDTRTLRPATAETDRDGADRLLQCERRELAELKQEVESALRDTLTQLQALGQCSRQLLECASERACVLELLPHGASFSAGRATPSQALVKPDPVGPFTPECKQVLEASAHAVSQSQQLRTGARQLLTSAISRQRAAHCTVNDGLVKKIAETIALKQRLTLTSAAARQATFRKQRQLNAIRHSHDRALGPEYSGDLLSREKLNRPIVQVYQKHPGTQLPEASYLIQGSAVLGRGLLSSGEELARLQGTCVQLLDNLRGKRVAAQVDSAVVRMRRRKVDQRAMPTFLQQEVY